MAAADPGNTSGIIELRTKAQVNSAQMLVRETAGMLTQNALIGLDSKYAQTVTCRLRAKQASTTQLTKALQDRIRKIDAMTRSLKESDLQLHRACALKQAPLCICTRRLHLRAQRAPAELSRDTFQQAIEAETAALVSARKELNDNSLAVRDLLPRLEEAKRDLLDDCVEKRRTGHLDHLCLLNGSGRSALSVEELMCAPTLQDVMDAEPPFSPRDAAGNPIFNEEQRKDSTKSIILTAAGLCFEGEQLCESNKAQMKLHDLRCERANKRMGAAMKRSIAHNTLQKKSLEQQLEDTDKMLFAGKLSLGWTEKKLKQHENPLQVLSRQFSLRQRRGGNENIQDPVHKGLVDHLDAAKRSVQTLSSHVDGTYTLVQELHSTKLELQEQLGLKTMSLRLDQACARVTLKSVAGYFFTPTSRAQDSFLDASPPQSARGMPLRGYSQGNLHVLPEEETATLLSSRKRVPLAGSSKGVASPQVASSLAC